MFSSRPFGVEPFSAFNLPGFAPPVSNVAIVLQEDPSPRLRQAFVRPGVQGPNVGPPVTSTAITRQQDVTAPPPTSFAGVQGPNVGPPVRNVVLTSQEGVVAPPPRALPGIQGPNVAPAVRNTALTRQEQPDAPSPSFARLGTPPTSAVTVATPQGLAFTRQETPDHPRPRAVVDMGVQGPNVRPPVADTAITRQQQPDHPINEVFVRPSIQGPDVSPPVRNVVITRQEAPDLATRSTVPGVQGPNVGLTGGTGAFTSQQQPGEQPLSWLWQALATPLPIIVGFAKISVITRQEQPGEWFMPTLFPPPLPALFQRFGTLADDIREVELPEDVRLITLPIDL